VGERFAHGYREEVREVEEPEVEVKDALELHAGRGNKSFANKIFISGNSNEKDFVR